jgi:hypothetical protein
MTRIAVLGVALLLGACASGAPAPVARPGRLIAPPPRLTGGVGLEKVLGQNARALTAMFGRPDADVIEGPARKLQFGSGICVLDAYFYPPRGGRGEPTVTHVDTRQRDGSAIDRASCIAALSRRGGGK